MSDDQLSPRGRLVVGLLCLLCGLAPILGGLGIAPFAEGRVPGVPDWVPIAGGGVFVLAGIAIVANHRTVGALAGLAATAGLAAIGNWIAFGAGVRNCTMTFSGGWSGSRAAGDLTCRLAFGWGAALTDVLVLLLALTLVRKTFGDRAWLGRLQKFCEGVLLIVLAPLLLVLVVLALLGGGGGALSGWFSRRFGKIKKDGGDSR